MPLPAEAEKEIVTIEGRRLRLRPIGPDDDDALIDMARRSTPDDLRLRFFTPNPPGAGAAGFVADPLRPRSAEGGGRL
jgi:hypothetical protein